MQAGRSAPALADHDIVAVKCGAALLRDLFGLSPAGKARDPDPIERPFAAVFSFNNRSLDTALVELRERLRGVLLFPERAELHPIAMMGCHHSLSFGRTGRCWTDGASTMDERRDIESRVSLFELRGRCGVIRVVGRADPEIVPAVLTRCVADHGIDVDLTEILLEPVGIGRPVAVIGAELDPIARPGSSEIARACAGRDFRQALGFAVRRGQRVSRLSLRQSITRRGGGSWRCLRRLRFRRRCRGRMRLGGRSGLFLRPIFRWCGGLRRRCRRGGRGGRLRLRLRRRIARDLRSFGGLQVNGAEDTQNQGEQAYQQQGRAPGSAGRCRRSFRLIQDSKTQTR